jgi:hypothetical protein
VKSTKSKPRRQEVFRIIILGFEHMRETERKRKQERARDRQGPGKGENFSLLLHVLQDLPLAVHEGLLSSDLKRKQLSLLSAVPSFFEVPFQPAAPANQAGLASPVYAKDPSPGRHESHPQGNLLCTEPRRFCCLFFIPPFSLLLSH